MTPEQLAQVALGVAGAALLGLLLLAARLSRLARAHRALRGADESASFVQAVERQTAASRALRDDVELLRDDVARARADLTTTLRHVAVVRFDAFGDTGGRQSFSAALLDDGGDGLVITSITGRTESRTYCKGIQGGRSEQPLSPEESEAVERAQSPSASPPPPSRKGGRR